LSVDWVVPEKIHTPPTEEISAVQRGRGDKIVSDNSKCIRTSEGGRGINFQFPLWGWYGCFLTVLSETYADLLGGGGGRGVNPPKISLTS
jgi:hypothetical protein